MTTFLFWLWSFPVAEWQGHRSHSADQRCACPQMALSRTYCHSGSFANTRWGGGWPQGNCCVLILSQSFKHRIRESDSKSEKKIQNNFRKRRDGPLLELQYWNMKKEEGGGDRENMNFPFPFSKTNYNSLLINHLGRKLRWWSFGCHGNYSAVCSCLMHL